MKELTIEEKARRYNEAIKRAKELLEIGVKDTRDKRVVLSFFPELKESEDERIRKEIISHFNETIDNIRSEEIVPHDAKVLIGKMQKWLSWLEKQGEQKPNFCHHKVDLSNCSEEYRKAYYDGWNNCNMQHSQCKSELDDVVKCLINGMKFYYEDNEEATWGTDKWSMPVKHIIEVLERQGEKGANGKEREIPNSAWSEEDKRIIDNLISQLGNLYARKLIKEETKDKYVNWLKSLRPQSQWKPSEEQMEALKSSTYCQNEQMSKVLFELYQDFKKLREE